MAIYHMQAKVVSRGSGRSAVAASAYMSCSRMYNDYDGIQHDYTRKQGLIYQEMMLPPTAPSKWIDREQLWNAVEENEKTKDSRLAREFVVALPVELDKDSNISLLQDFIKKNFVDMGMCADFAIHDTDGHNPHAHILLTVRPLNENGTWQYKTEKEYLCIKKGEEKGFTASESIRAIPFAPRLTQQFIFSFHVSSEAQAVASDLWAYINICSLKGYLYSLAAVVRNLVHSFSFLTISAAVISASADI